MRSAEYYVVSRAGAMSSFIGIFASATLSLAEEPETPTPKSKSSDSGDDPQARLHSCNGSFACHDAAQGMPTLQLHCEYTR